MELESGSERRGQDSMRRSASAADERVHLSEIDGDIAECRLDRLELEAWPTDRAQVCVQAPILREHGYACDEAVVYYNRTKQRVRVPLTDELVAATLASIDDGLAACSRSRRRGRCCRKPASTTCRNSTSLAA
jgi:hypothetical protein